jgi:hypothetical protein
MERIIERKTIIPKMQIRKKTSRIDKVIKGAVIIKAVIPVLKKIWIRQSFGIVSVIGWLAVLRVVYTALKDAKA